VTGDGAGSPGRLTRLGDERGQQLEERAAQLRRRSAELLAQVDSARGRAEQAVKHARAILDASRDRVRRAEAVLLRAEAQAAGSLELGDRRPAPPAAGVTGMAGRSSALRERTAAAAAQLARCEEITARVHDDLASRDPGNPQYRRLADEARRAARWAREMEQRYSSH
jgi:hypothetical protein